MQPSIVSFPSPARCRGGRTGSAVALLACAAGLFLAAVPASAAHHQEEGSRENGTPADSAAVRTDAPRTPELRAVRPPASPPEVDGRLDDPAWARAAVARDFVQFEPEWGAEPSQPTEVRLLYTDDAVYVGARMYDSSPDSIVARLARRDDMVTADMFLVGFDSYLDRRTGFVFGVNAAGVQYDFLLYDDTREDDNWDAVWGSAVAVDSLGWTAELRIPLSQLRFSVPEEGGAVWGLNFQRELARRDETSQWAPFPEDRSRIVSAFGRLTGLEGLRPAHHLEVRPYSVVRTRREPGLSSDPFHEPTDLAASFGGDVSYGLTRNLTLNATVNPDFGQVEADPSVVNLGAFETFFPEKRPFFQEGVDIFRFDIGLGDGGNEELFYTRRIGRRPRGRAPSDALFSEVPEATTILGAAKLSGKTEDGWSLGFMDAVTAEERAAYTSPDGRGETAVEPMTNYAVGRAIRNFRDGQSAVGAVLTATNRSVDPDGPLAFLPGAAYAGGVNARHRFGGGDYLLRGWALASHVAGSAAAIDRFQRSPTHFYQRPDADHLEYDPDRESLTGGAASLELLKVGGEHWRYGAIGHLRTPGFEVNPLGFQQGADQVVTAAFVGYREFEPGPLFRRWNVNANAWTGTTFGGERIGRGGNVNGSFQLTNHWNGFGGVNHQVWTVSPHELRGGPALRNDPRTNGWLGLRSDGRRAVEYGMNLNWGLESGAESRRVSLSPRVELQASDRLRLSLSPRMTWNRQAAQYVTTRPSETGSRYVFGLLEQRTAALTLRAGYTATPTLSVQLYAQPFLTSGDYTRFREVEDPLAERFDRRFHTFDPSEISADGEGGYRVDRDRDGAADFAFSDPDFEFGQLRSNLVVRWEYRPGSTLFVVWSQERGYRERDGSFHLGRNADRLFGAPATNVFLVKMEYWLGL